jgi:hypothetical protein
MYAHPLTSRPYGWTNLSEEKFAKPSNFVSKTLSNHKLCELYGPAHEVKFSFVEEVPMNQSQPRQ